MPKCWCQSRLTQTRAEAATGGPAARHHLGQVDVQAAQTHHGRQSRPHRLAGLLRVAPMEPHGGHRLGRGLHQRVDHGIGGLERAVGRGALADLLDPVGPLAVDLAEEDVVLEHRELPEELEVFGGALGGRGPARPEDRLAPGLGHQQQLLLHELLDEFVVQSRGLGIMHLGRQLDAVGQRTVRRGHQRHQPLARVLPALPVEGRLEDRPQAVVVGLGDGVVAVVVALGAMDGEPKQRRRDDLDRVGDDLVAGQLRLGRAVARGVRCHAQEPGGHQAVEVAARQVGGDGRQQLVAGQLLGDELVEGPVVVEGADDVVAIAPGPRALGIGLDSAVGVGVAGDVEPVAPPALTVGRRGQQPVHQALIARVGRVLDECLDLLRRRRQPGQVEGDAADQGLRSGLRGEPEALPPEPIQQEGVDRRPDLPAGPDRGRLRMPHRLEGPERAFLFGDDPARDLGGLGPEGRGPLGDPPLEDGHLLR